MLHTLNFIDLFAGAGGLSEGFIRAGYTLLAHIEMDKYACYTLKTRAAFHYLKSKNELQKYKKYLYEKQEKEDGSKLWEQVSQEIIDSVIHEAIGEDTIDKIFAKIDKLKSEKQVDIIIGGPPCQAYSVAGRARMGKAVEDDPRNELYKFYVKFLERYQPKMFVFENVLGICTAKNGEPLKALTRLVEKAGYKMELKVQTASEHGVLQHRQRVIIIGWKVKDENGNPTNYHYPDLKPEKIKETFLNRFQVVAPYNCSHTTVVAHIAMDGHYYIHPTLNPTIENVRSITIREAARLQSFPDDYYFEGSRSAAFKQIGNAVPVVLAEKIAKEIKKQFE
ncbi:MAG: DNA (cytosine-5-)-methyltransferase [Campylobacteraceae bacterium]|jgi:DNA-cytosine methyltransferase|nr:DNA (cytosine-5-)-methyltransferase [Campylobacteraceae bacterium]